MSVTSRIARTKQHLDKHHNAFSAAAAIVQMDPHARADLITYLKALNKAQRAGDEQEQEYLVRALLEVFEINGSEDAPELDAWENELRSASGGSKATTELQDETDAFFKAYQHHKARCGLKTIREVATAAHLSPTTVQAIEKQRVKPQFRTIGALAKAFRVEPKSLGAR